MSEAMRRYSQAQAQMRALEVGELEQARMLVDAELAEMDRRLADAIHAELVRIEKEFGYTPAEIEVRMVEMTGVTDEWRRHRLCSVNASY